MTSDFVPSISTVAPEIGASTIYAADARATKNARLQAQGKPWPCPKKRAHITTNEKCLAAHELGVDRLCRDCTIPNILPTTEDNMPKGPCDCCDATGVTLYRLAGVNRCYHCHMARAEPKGGDASATVTSRVQPAVKEVTSPKRSAPAEAVPAPRMEEPCTSSPNWDDFSPLNMQAPSKELLAYAVLSMGKLCFSRAAVPTLPFHPGESIELRYSKDRQALALRKVLEKDPRNRKLTDDGAHRLNLSILRHTKEWDLPSGRFGIEVVPWGVVVHFDQPVAPQTNRKLKGEAA